MPKIPARPSNAKLNFSYISLRQQYGVAHLLGLLLLLILSASSALLAWHVLHQPHAQDDYTHSTPLPHAWADEADYRAIHANGQDDVYLHAYTIQNHEAPPQTTFQKPHFVWYNREKQTIWELRADCGKSPHLSRVIDFQGHIVLNKWVQGEKQVRLMTNQLRVHPKEKRIDSQSAGTAYYPSGTVRFKRFNADLKKNSLDLLGQTHMIYQNKSHAPHANR